MSQNAKSSNIGKVEVVGLILFGISLMLLVVVPLIISVDFPKTKNPQTQPEYKSEQELIHKRTEALIDAI